MSQTTNWTSAELVKGTTKGYVLAMAFQVGGVDLSGDITSYAHIENPTNVGNYETVKCKVTFVKPD